MEIRKLPKQVISFFRENKENIISVTITAGVIIPFFLGSGFFKYKVLSYIWIFNLTLLIAVLAAIIVMTGFAVLKSLAYVGAELSLLLYIAQSYCSASPVRNPAGDDALKILLVLGFIYITFTFFKSLFQYLVKGHQKIKKHDRSWHKTIIVILTIVLTAMLIWDIYLVVSPIIQNLCINQPA